MKYIIILFLLSSISLSAQEKIKNNHFSFKTEIGGGYAIWKSRTAYGDHETIGPDFNFNLTPYYTYRNLLLGISYGYEKIFIPNTTTASFPNETIPKYHSVNFNKISFSIGYNVIQYKRFAITVLSHFGTYKLDKSFTRKYGKNYVIAGAGVDFNYLLSNRISLSFQPNFEYKYYALDPDFVTYTGLNAKISLINSLIGLKIMIL